MDGPHLALIETLVSARQLGFSIAEGHDEPADE
jgi:hypothetical protein